MTGEPIHPVPRLPRREAKARKPLLRKTYMKKRTSKRVAAKTPAERDFLKWLHEQPCAGLGFVYDGGRSTHRDCDRNFPRVEAAHFRDHTGAGRCEPYSTCIPLCKYMHDNYDGRRRGVFSDMSMDERKDWHRARQVETQAAYKARFE